MKKLLILGTSNGSCDIVRYAKSQGIYVIVTDYLEPSKSPAKLLADEYWMINTGDIEALYERSINVGVTAVFCGVSGFNINASMELCRRMALPFYCTPEALHYGRDKADFKKMCRKVGAPVAQDYFLDDDFTDEDAAHVKFPVVVKPVDRGANLGISFCNNIEELRSAIKLVRKVSENPKIVIERMLKGEEWFSTYAISNSEPRYLALNAMYHEPGYPSSCYSLTTTVTHHVEQYLAEINPKIEEVLKAVGCTNGYAWVQVMRDEVDGKFYIIEMGYRLDGDMLYWPVKYLNGYDVTKAMVDYACGIDSSDVNPLPESPLHAYSKCGAGLRFWTKRKCCISRIEGLELLTSIPHSNVEFRKSTGDCLDEYRPLGTITFCAENCDELCEIIKFVNENFHVYDEEGEDVIIKYTNFDYLKKVYQEGLEGK